MQLSNSKYIEAVVLYERDLQKPTYDTSMSVKVDFFLEAYRHITGRTLLKAEDRIVDFGCGSGAATNWLTQEGYNAHGVDILEYWGKDSHLLGEVGPRLSDDVRARLNVIDPVKNDLPFPDSSIRLILSDQTLEHVFDYRPVFAEQARVLELGGVAIHRFPRGSCFIEPHTKVPLAPLTKFPPYLLIWALLGRRNARQVGRGWRETFASNRRVLATTNYVSRRTILHAARGLGMDAWFEDFLSISDRRAGRLYRSAASVGMGGPARTIISHIQDNRVLVLRKPVASSCSQLVDIQD
jgi:SAM-dependent methyltransferase